MHTPPGSLTYPLYATPVIQAAVQCRIKDGVVTLPEGGRVRNRYIQSVLGHPELNGLEGLLRAGATIAETKAMLEAAESISDFGFHASDRFDLKLPLKTRISYMLLLLNRASWHFVGAGFVFALVPTQIDGPDALAQCVEDYRRAGHHALALRSPEHSYAETHSEILSLKEKLTQ